MVVSKVLAALFVLGVLIAIFKEYTILILVIGVIAVIAWFVIRAIADVYWWGKDRGKW